MSPLPARNPPFTVEHIGSLLRPRTLTQAFRAFAAGEIEDAEFRSAQDTAIREAIAMQESLGLAVVTDGEFRRGSYWGHFIEAVDGFTTKPALFEFHDEHGATQRFIAAQVVGRVRRRHGISTEEFKFAASVARKATVKITLPSPSTLQFWRGRADIEKTAYADLDAFFADLCSIYRDELGDLAALGCRYVQLDEVPLIMLADPTVREIVRGRGDDPDRLVGLYIDALNQAIAGRAPGMRLGMHMCRGNFKGKWLAESGYDAIAERVFDDVAVDVLFLEYDTPRAGDFAPLRFVPKEKGVVLGLVSSKTATLEDRDEIRRRVEEAAHYVPLERLAISPQCGFASTVAGNPITIEDEKAKLRLLVETAREIWGA
ncbi:MAG TPA: 5-methyltetrahydropteroyltriglutamate--homocysteine S-methyltransferase [Stellaceae bacterium]|nr:5-methyltetrahydropteroyltriglutamate--homocysteine S-methyltransferase [Stellaceae bacterium]